jgi:hypothetical protein
MPYPMFSFSAEDLQIHRCCFFDFRVSDMNALRGCLVPATAKIPANIWWSLPSTNDTDPIWSFQLDHENGERAAVEVAVFCATSILPSFTHLYPEDTRPQEAIAAAQAWLDNPTEETALVAGDKAKRALRAGRLPPEGHTFQESDRAKRASLAAYFAALATDPRRNNEAASASAASYLLQHEPADLRRFIHKLYGVV